MKKNYWVLWTFCANFGDKPVHTQAENVIDAIMNTYGHVFCLTKPDSSSFRRNREGITFHVFSEDGHEYSGNFERLEMLSCEKCKKLCDEGDLNHDEESEMALCSECVLSADSDVELEEDVIRGKWTMDGSRTLLQAAGKLRTQALELEQLDADGWKLTGPVEDDYGYIKKR